MGAPCSCARNFAIPCQSPLSLLSARLAEPQHELIGAAANIALKYAQAAIVGRVAQDLAFPIGERKCYFTDHDPYFIVNGATLDGDPCEYAIFFKVSKALKGGRLRVFVVSAYPIDAEGVPLKRTKQIKFSVIAYNTRNNRPIKAPR